MLLYSGSFNCSFECSHRVAVLISSIVVGGLEEAIASLIDAVNALPGVIGDIITAKIDNSIM